jgi:DNA-binding FadR family transcriptional regulator
VPAVAVDDAHPLVRDLSLTLRWRGGSFRELYDVRRLLEAAAAFPAAQRHDPADLVPTREAPDTMRRRMQDHGDEDVEADIEFHRTINVAAHNSDVRDTLPVIKRKFPMTRVHARSAARATAPAGRSSGSEAPAIRRLPANVQARMHELAQRSNEGLLTSDERREFDRLVDVASEQMLKNARALLYDRDPASYEAALAEERGTRRHKARRTR